MAIHLDILSPRQAEAGKIKIGGLGERRPKRSGKGSYQIPTKHDHFIVTTTTRDDSGNFAPDTSLMATLPKEADDKLREIPILLDSDDLDEVFPTSLAAYTGRTLLCRGDGETATRHELRRDAADDGTPVTVKTGQSTTIDCTCDYLGATEGTQCRPHGTLWCTIVAGEETRIGARHGFRTTSWHSIRAIRSGLDTIQQIVGTLVGVPLWLCVQGQIVRPRGSSSNKTIYVVHIECRTRDLLALQRHAIEQAKTRHAVAQIAGTPIRLGLPMPADSTETPGDQARLQQEFHPEDEGDEYDQDGFDPQTGEVFPHERAFGALEADPPAPGPESQEQDDPLVDLPEDHPVRNDIKQLLTDLAKARDFSADDMQRGRVEIWAEVTEAAGFPRLPWRSLTLARAQKIGPEFQRLLKLKHEPEDEDQRPQDWDWTNNEG